jgi:hypothetical protein
VASGAVTVRREVPAGKLRALDVTELGEGGRGVLIVGHVGPPIHSPDGVVRVQVLGLSGQGNLVLVGIDPERLMPVYFYDGPGAGPGSPPEAVSA